MTIWSMLQVMSQKNEKKKKNLAKNDSLCISVIRGRCVYLGGFQGVKKDRRLQSLKIIKGSIFFIGRASKWNQENSYAPLKTF